ncbi:MAG: AAA family ATPase [Planctomycetes bacterium]|nr:AAA family ATPase [Planctomycetota bacterium]
MERIALIGLSGSGKSTVGKLLADRIGVPFLDVDEALELKSGWSPTRWIHEKGLPAFRAAESLLVADATERKAGPLVMATGGGAVELAEVCQLLSTWRCFWLDAPDSILLDRCREGSRPLLEGDDPGRLLGQLRRRRETSYRHLSGDPLETEGISPSRVVDAILSRLEEAI